MNYVEFLQGVAIATLAIVGALSSWRIKELEARVFLVESMSDAQKASSSLEDCAQHGPWPPIPYNPRGKSSTGSDGSGESQ